jgi:hypothetical protein
MLQILSVAIRVVVAVVFAASLAMTFTCVVASFVAVASAVKGRKSGVHVLTAASGYNIIFRPELYTDDTRRWLTVYIYATLGAFLFPICGFVTGWLLTLWRE